MARFSHSGASPDPLEVRLTYDGLDVDVSIEFTEDGPLLRLVAGDGVRLDGDCPGDYYLLPSAPG